MTKNRADYNWDDANEDLAFNTHLTLSEARTVTRALKEIAHPYDALPHLMRLFSSETPINARAAALKDLMVRTPYPEDDET